MIKTTVSMLLELMKNPEDLLEQCDAEYLSEICKLLFTQVEEQHQLLQKVLGKSNISSLTRIKDLYINGDAETIWGQVELQNSALIRPLLKKSIKNLSSTAIQDTVVLLDMKEFESSSEKDNNISCGSNSESGSDEFSPIGNNESDDGDDEVSIENADDETKRIKSRMARVMIDMEDEDRENSEKKEVPGGNKDKLEKEDGSKDVIDPAREDMLDGFFDLHEMEAFADEEEEYLPDAIFGQEKKEEETEMKEEKISFHERQRRGHNILDDDDESDDDQLALRQTLTRRRKYRPEDEVRALLSIYDTPKSQSDNDDAVNMTAADLFGPPDLTARKKWLGKNKSISGRTKFSSDSENDADSWDKHDFNEGAATDWNITEDNGLESSKFSGDGDGKINEFIKGSDLFQNASKKERKLLKQTKDLEEEMLAEKPWQMKGEAQGKARPVNSLLESTPEFETATKSAPTITVQHTNNIEGIIKRRILEEEWDDVVPRELPDVGWNQKRGIGLPEVSQEQSKLGLGELYEREYLKKAAGYDTEKAEKETEESTAKNEMKALFANLCSKLDALSNYHFTPRTISDEVEIRPISTPAIAMEEILPQHVSNERGVAPEEVFAAKKCHQNVLTGDSELSQKERKKRRNSKKAARRKARKEKLADEKLVSRLQPSIVHNPYEKRKMREKLQMARSEGRIKIGLKDQNEGYGKSATFFQKLQNETAQSIPRLKENLKKRKFEGITTGSSLGNKL